jgi:hypothetical protein
MCEGDTQTSVEFYLEAPLQDDESTIDICVLCLVEALRLVVEKRGQE